MTLSYVWLRFPSCNVGIAQFPTPFKHIISTKTGSRQVCHCIYPVVLPLSDCCKNRCWQGERLLQGLRRRTDSSVCCYLLSSFMWWLCSMSFLITLSTSPSQRAGSGQTAARVERLQLEGRPERRLVGSLVLVDRVLLEWSECLQTDAGGRQNAAWTSWRKGCCGSWWSLHDIGWKNLHVRWLRVSRYEEKRGIQGWHQILYLSAYTDAHSCLCCYKFPYISLDT